jgi:PAS domain S-box-containing protein/excisionase family DNA binding protein
VKDYLTVQDIAQKLDVTADTVRRWLRAGKLKGIPLGRAGYRIHESDFQLFMGRCNENPQQLHKHEQLPTPEAHSLPPTVSSMLSNGDDLPSLAYNAIFIRDPMNVITTWNQEATRLYGWSEQEVLGQMAYTLLHTSFPVSREEVELQLIQVGHWEGELRSLDRNGQEIIVESHQILRRNGEGRPDSILEIDRDITDHKHIEETLILAREQAETVARDIHEQKERDQRKDTFASLVSHELRTPLTSISANLQLAERCIKNILQQEEEPSRATQKATSDALHMLDRALRQTKVMNRLIGDLLDSTRIQANKLNLSLNEHDIIAIMRDTIMDQLEITPQRSIRLAPLPDTQNIIVLIDKDRIRQVIGNYLTNALKYSAASEEVTIGVTVDAELVRVWVHDHGPGLTAEQQEHIWDRHYQAKDVTVRSGSGNGLGLGLHICKTLISRHGGEVGVDSKKGYGSTFWFQLPLANTLYS